MKEKIKYYNIVQILSNILLFISLIVVLIVKSDFSYNLYWCIVPVTILGNIYFIGKWSKGGIDLDKNKSSKINRSLDDSTVSLTVLYALVYLGIMFIECFDVTIKTNIYIVLVFYIITLAFELFISVLVDTAIKDTKKIIKETIKK